MSFICAICRDLLKLAEEEASPQHQHQFFSLVNGEQSPSKNGSPANNNGRRKGKNNSIVATKCGHIFHYSCLSVWLAQSMNITSDSKMRCPSCKQLIYIYELIQLFPVENGCNKYAEPLFSSQFQQKLKSLLGQLETLCKELYKKQSEISGPLKGNETPTRMQRIKDSPKRSQTAQVTQLTKEMDSLRGSIKELNELMEQHAELGSIVETQTLEISELRSKNEQLILANERLKSTKEEKTVLADHKSDAHHGLGERQGTKYACDGCVCGDVIKEEGTNAQECIGMKPTDVNPQLPAANLRSPDVKDVVKSSRRKSVTFLDGFDHDELQNSTRDSKPTVPLYETKDLRVGDKVIWSFEGSPEIGTVRWKGFIGSQINVGVEFDRQLGLPIKDLASDAIQCIFKCKPGHGRLLPVRDVVLCTKENLSNYSMSGTPLSDNGCQSTNGINKRVQLCTHQ